MHSHKDHLLAAAQQRASESNLQYFGALTPTEAWELLQADADAVLVDVRTQAELDWVGQIGFSEDRWVHVEWSTYPEGSKNPDFLEAIQARVDTTQPVLLLCRSGARSHNAATLLSKHGYGMAINVLEGFEGDKDEQQRRSSVNGWRHRGLPWEQH